MDWLNDMASGSAGIVTALGMGTVFVCLALLYFMTHLLGALMSSESSRRAAAATGESGADGGAADPPVEQPNPGDDQQAIAAAVTLALARHRAARARPVESPGAVGAWKLAGRIGMLR